MIVRRWIVKQKLSLNKRKILILICCSFAFFLTIFLAIQQESLKERWNQRSYDNQYAFINNFELKDYLLLSESKYLQKEPANRISIKVKRERLLITPAKTAHTSLRTTIRDRKLERSNLPLVEKDQRTMKSREHTVHKEVMSQSKKVSQSAILTYNQKKIMSKEEIQKVIHEYQKNEVQICTHQEQQANIKSNQSDLLSHLPSCPCIPKNLKGRLTLNLSYNKSLVDLWRTDHSDVLLGGEWLPDNCRSRTRLALIIPYRDRFEHLHTFLFHMLPILKRQNIHFRIFLTEQNEPAIFNKAAMMNIGFLEAMKLFSFDCVVFHDIDILMEDDRSLLNCGDSPHHYAISLDRWNYSLKYDEVFGAVISMRPEMVNLTNGFSNSFFGWGGEDDDMGQRVKRFWKVYRPPEEIARYTTIKHKRDNANAKNKERLEILKRQKDKYSIDGLNSIRYRLRKVELRPLFTWISADLEISQLPYPRYASNNYMKMNGLCAERNAFISSSHMSFVTCQYECDILDYNCTGFSHGSDDMLNVCHILHKNCSRLVTDMLFQTYFKLSKLR